MKKKRILLIDDEVGFTRLCKLNLEQRAEYEVRVENWAEEAVNTAREFRPDLVLLDLIMPRMIGGDVAAHLRADASLHRTPIVFLSAAGVRQSGDEPGSAPDAFPFISKPASMEELIEGIELNLLEPSDSEGGLVSENSENSVKAGAAAVRRVSFES